MRVFTEGQLGVSGRDPAVGPPWLGLLHYNLHKRGKGKRPRFREESQRESTPYHPIPGTPRG